MGETIKVGQSFDHFVSAKREQPDGTWSYVSHPAGGLLMYPESVTVIEIIPRPKNEREIPEFILRLMKRITDNQNVIDGKLYHSDHPAGKFFDPHSVYIVET